MRHIGFVGNLSDEKVALRIDSPERVADLVLDVFVVNVSFADD